jgi:hypothetical protein
MTVLTTLDLEGNEIRGRLPESLGLLSPHLDKLTLNLNFLSCDVPESVRRWVKSPGFKRFHLLNGNSFGCGGTQGALALSIQGAAGLEAANRDEFRSYACGGSAFVLPLCLLGAIAAPVFLGLVVAWLRGRLHLRWRVALEWRVASTTGLESSLSSSPRDRDWDRDQDEGRAAAQLGGADRELRALALGVGGACAAACAMATVLASPRLSRAAYECDYGAGGLALGNRVEKTTGGAGWGLSAGVGAVAGFALALGTALWWWRFFFGGGEHPAPTSTGGGADKDDVSLATMTYGQHRAAAAGGPAPLSAAGGSERPMAEATSSSAPSRPPGTKPDVSGWLPVLKFALLFCLMMALAALPNLAYVLVELSQLPYEQKIAGVLGITAVKVLSATVGIPWVTRLAVDAWVVPWAPQGERFRRRLVLSAVFTALGTVAVPVIVVALTDERCLLRFLQPPEKVTDSTPPTHPSAPISFSPSTHQ